ncbi:hypothetical protein K469DRAFT_153553 [Zopfia rhizophila CBS 207.26]|uniref:Uncharacterized protein n=1 Tax=Zopfia rhizophila CBS 207.26 TaxID=1314779 RepID=A0A6A6E639_9PEZI|nr:hypothetical protein K469DRAFT_153553 [Zopfia rhizophila CBS 207.26]
MVAPLLGDFGFYTKKTLLDGLQPDEGIYIFEGHIELNKVALDHRIGLEDPQRFKDKSIPWKDAKSKIVKLRVLVEYEQSDVPLGQEQGTSGPGAMSSSVKQLYAPQLAALLRTARRHYFHTPGFEEYAWGSFEFPVRLLFDYSSDAGDPLAPQPP